MRTWIVTALATYLDDRKGLLLCFLGVALAVLLVLALGYVLTEILGFY